MPAAFYNLHVLTALLLIYLFFGGIGFLGYQLNRRYFRKSNNLTLITTAQQTSLTFGTLFIAFWIALNWQTLDNLNLDSKNEAQAILSISSSANLIDSPAQQQTVKLAINDYLDSVIHQEYHSLEQGEVNQATDEKLTHLSQQIYLLPTHTLEQKIVYNKMLESLNGLVAFRLKRLDYAAGQINGVLLIFFVMLLMLICFWSACVNNNLKKLTVLVIISQNLIILSSAWLILEIDRPFQGYFKVGNQAFVNIQKNILVMENLRKNAK